MQVPSDIVPGPLLSRHGRTRAHRFVLAVALMCLVLGAGLPLLLFTSARVAPEGRPLILGTAGLLLAFGIVLTVRIPIADIAKLDEGGANGSLRLFDAYGHTLWSVHTLSLFSADLFIVLMRTMIEAHQYGITQKNRPPEIHTRAADAGVAGDVTGREDGES